MSKKHQIKMLEDEARSIKASADQIDEIEEEIRNTKYNKATQGHIGRLKAKLARIKAEAEKKSGGGKHGLGYAIKKQGDATVVLVGFPSAGKSTLLNQLSNAESKTGDYEFTTLNVVPGVMELNGAKVQVLDVPGFIEGASKGKGRGKEVLSVLRSADLILIVLDAGKDYRWQLGVIEKELYEAGFRLNQEPPEIIIKKKSTGGLQVGSAVRLTKLDIETIKGVLREFRINNAEVNMREDIDIDRLIDSIARNRKYVPSISLLNKVDLLEGRPEVNTDLEVSGLEGRNLDRLRQMVWEMLGLMRVFMKKIGKEPDMVEPFVFRKGITVKGVCDKIHKEMAKNLKYARVWGSGKFPGQRKGGGYVLKDSDIVELHLG